MVFTKANSSESSTGVPEGPPEGTLEGLTVGKGLGEGRLDEPDGSNTEGGDKGTEEGCVIRFDTPGTEGIVSMEFLHPQREIKEITRTRQMSE